ncbi:MAG: hypothetical protein JWN39_1545 [Ilumatobacteraceae bacterium]|nr:hypothetical protein [Ilumatobacteraceae bacterium]
MNEPDDERPIGIGGERTNARGGGTSDDAVSALLASAMADRGHGLRLGPGSLRDVRTRARQRARRRVAVSVGAVTAIGVAGVAVASSRHQDRGPYQLLSTSGDAAGPVPASGLGAVWQCSGLLPDPQGDGALVQAPVVVMSPSTLVGVAPMPIDPAATIALTPSTLAGVPAMPIDPAATFAVPSTMSAALDPVSTSTVVDAQPSTTAPPLPAIDASTVPPTTELAVSSTTAGPVPDTTIVIDAAPFTTVVPVRAPIDQGEFYFSNCVQIPAADDGSANLPEVSALTVVPQPSPAVGPVTEPPTTTIVGAAPVTMTPTSIATTTIVAGG